MPLEFSTIDKFCISRKMTPFELSSKDAAYLIALLESNKQTALQLLAADHFYQPSLLPRLKKFQQALKNERAAKEPKDVD
jgi:hypothetical protein